MLKTASIKVEFIDLQGKLDGYYSGEMTLDQDNNTIAEFLLGLVPEHSVIDYLEMFIWNKSKEVLFSWVNKHQISLSEN